MSQRFSAVIGKAGINPSIDVPAQASVALGRTGYVPVCATINGHAFRAGLVPVGGGRHRLFVNGQMRKSAGVDVGDTVEVELDFDPEPRGRLVPAQLATALEADPSAGAAWEALTPSRRNEILDYLNSLKQPESIRRNVDKVMTSVLAGASAHRRGGDKHPADAQEVD